MNINTVTSVLTAGPQPSEPRLPESGAAPDQGLGPAIARNRETLRGEPPGGYAGLAGHAKHSSRCSTVHQEARADPPSGHGPPSNPTLPTHCDRPSKPSAASCIGRTRPTTRRQGHRTRCPQEQAARGGSNRSPLPGFG
eukprot:CAMPEP_0204277674 /NCGR_PEP_ID=MMETSP0468-20130131/29442_1 /ASSEMBLY_ACC=CAM_ASM_000383 /TAXON_ID=2969 /ORGANISM="Oxyrrhis marina" /LENGTH=138 /DNA_ID=CAMNT_0051254495 /DNA_START=17 /DNA_END=430 /DNA_ORIENTATION=-